MLYAEGQQEKVTGLVDDLGKVEGISMNTMETPVQKLVTRTHLLAKYKSVLQTSILKRNIKMRNMKITLACY